MPERSGSGMGLSQQRRAELLIQYENGAIESFKLPIAVGRALKLKKRKGIEVNSRSDLLAFVSELQKSCAKDRMLRLLERRDHSKTEVDRRLLADGYPSFAREYAIGLGEQYDFLNDERFAGAFAVTKLSAGWGLNKIEFELSRRGVDTSCISGWPEAFVDVDGEYARALDLATKKHVCEPNAYAKLTRFLLGRGYSYGIAKRAAKEALG